MTRRMGQNSEEKGEEGARGDVGGSSRNGTESELSGVMQKRLGVQGELGTAESVGVVQVAREEGSAKADDQPEIWGDQPGDAKGVV